MTRDDDRDGIGPTRLRHRARRLWSIDRLRDVEVSARRSGRNREKLVPNLALKIGTLQIQRESFVETPPTDSFLNGIERRPQPHIVARYFSLWKARAKVSMLVLKPDASVQLEVLPSENSVTDEVMCLR